MPETTMSLEGNLLIADVPFAFLAKKIPAGYSLEASAGDNQLNVLAFLPTLVPGIALNGIPQLNVNNFGIVNDNNAGTWQYNFLSEINWKQPFGIPVGINIDNLTASVTTAGDSGQAFVQLYGILEQLKVQIYLYFSDNKPALFSANAVESINATDIFKYFFGDKVPWPTSFIDINLVKSRIYYGFLDTYPANWQPSPVPNGYMPIPALTKGLNFYTEVNLTLAEIDIPPFSVRVAINAGEHAGFTISSKLQSPISLFSFLELSGSDFTGGPIFDLDTVTDTFGFDCGIILGTTHLGTATLFVINKDGERTLSALVTLEAVMGSPASSGQLHLTWSKSKGLSIINLPLYALGDIIKAQQLTEELEKLIKQNGCGDIVLDLTNNILSSQVTVEPSFGSAPASGSNSFLILINGFYKINCGNYNIISLDLPQLQFVVPIPEAFSVDGLFTMLEQIIADNMDTIVSQLWADKVALAKILAVFVGKEALQSLASQLICDGLKAILDSFLKAMGDVGTSIAGILSGVGSGIAGGGGGGCGGGGGGGGSSGGGGSGPISVNYLTPPVISKQISYNDAQLSFKFTNSNSIINGYEYQWLQDVNVPAVKAIRVDKVLFDTMSPFSAIIPFDIDTMPGGNYYFDVKFLATGNSEFADSDFAELALQKLRAPSNVTISATGQKIVINWDIVSGVGFYSVQLINVTDPSNPIIIMIPIVTSNTASYTVHPTTGISYWIAKVCSKASNGLPRYNGSVIDSNYTNAASEIDIRFGLGYTFIVGTGFFIS